MSEHMHAVVIGASGGIGAALVEQLAGRDDITRVTAFARSPVVTHSRKVVAASMDLLDEASIGAGAQACTDPPPRLVLCATGILHGADFQPEKSLRDIDPAKFARVMAINTIGPALVLKHFLPTLPREGRSVIALLSARVGSIADNRLGGWYAYRSSKAALNQLVRTASIEAARRWKDAVIVGLHPGTVATSLSAPFRGNVAPGKLFTPGQSASYLLSVLDKLSPADTGKCFAWDGSEIPP
ncbi:MAG: SDR family NAD(P)-dependent oxidoreductase [Steroidobacteraceae bacterium]